MTITNFDKRIYVVKCGKQVNYLDSGQSIVLDAESATIKRRYSKNSLLNLLLNFLVFLVFLLFVFFESDGNEESKAGIIKVTYKIKKNKQEDNPQLSILNSSVLNIEKNIPAIEYYKFNPVYFIAHIMSIIATTLMVVSLFAFLSYLCLANHASWGIACIIVGTCIAFLGTYITIKSIKNLKNILSYLRKYYGGILEG